MKKLKEKLQRERGAISVEAALVMPIFILAIISIAYIMQALHTQSEVYSFMYSGVRDLAINAHDTENCSVSSMKDNVEKYSNKSLANVSFTNSKYMQNNGMIELKALYNFKIPTILYKFNAISLEQNISMRGFTGDENSKNNDKIVFVTKTGTVYHTHIDCTYLLIKVEEVKFSDIENKKNKSGGKYTPCEKCIKDGNCTAEKVYISNYGTAYHEQATCSAIKRTISTVNLSDVGGKPKCSKCSKRD